MYKNVVIASKNPVKIAAVKSAFESAFTKEEFQFKGVSVPSGVSDQPMSDKETYQGAMNRANNAMHRYKEADYWVGIEGGIQIEHSEMSTYAWVVILSEDLMGKATSGKFFLPPRVAALVNEGMELGDADDVVFGRSNSKQKNGAVGILTGNLIDRTNFYVDAVALALIPFRNLDLY